jgi:hypothetical protein
VDEARRLAEALTSKSGDNRTLVRETWRAILGRDPLAEEIERAAAFLEKQAAEVQTSGAVRELARALFNTNEFLYVD